MAPDGSIEPWQLILMLGLLGAVVIGGVLALTLVARHEKKSFAVWQEFAAKNAGFRCIKCGSRFELKGAILNTPVSAKLLRIRGPDYPTRRGAFSHGSALSFGPRYPGDWRSASGTTSSRHGS